MIIKKEKRYQVQTYIEISEGKYPQLNNNLRSTATIIAIYYGHYHLLDQIWGEWKVPEILLLIGYIARGNIQALESKFPKITVNPWEFFKLFTRIKMAVFIHPEIYEWLVKKLTFENEFLKNNLYSAMGETPQFLYFFMIEKPELIQKEELSVRFNTGLSIFYTYLLYKMLKPIKFIYTISKELKNHARLAGDLVSKIKYCLDKGYLKPEVLNIIIQSLNNEPEEIFEGDKFKDLSQSLILLSKNYL